MTCLKGAVLDVVVDIRVGSPTFGQWDAVLLDDVDRERVYLSEGLGHAFMSLEDGSTVIYLCSAPYTPGARARGPPARPRDRHRLAHGGSRRCAAHASQLSAKDEAAPTLAEAATQACFPRPMPRGLRRLAAC